MFPEFKKKRHPVYLDYAAATPVDSAVVNAMRPFWAVSFGNPSSLYRRGREALMAMERARGRIAELINARPQEIIFTAGGTESCNLAIFGTAENFSPRKKFKPHIIVSAIEHHAVLFPVRQLQARGFAVTELKTDAEGMVNVRELSKAVRPETILVSIMYANNEIGTIEPVREIGKLLAQVNLERARRGKTPVVFHTDACQAAGLDLNVQRLGVDLLSVNGSKIYGPKQVGFLFVRTGVNLKPVVYGGGQERGYRSGTENVPGVVGLAKALELAQGSRQAENKKLEKLQKFLIGKLKNIPGVRLNGPEAGPKRLANNINVSVDSVEGEVLMLYLDSYGIEVSTGSACATSSADPSHVLMAIGLTSSQAKNSIRLTLGRHTSRQELSYVCRVLPQLIKELRK